MGAENNISTPAGSWFGSYNKSSRSCANIAVNVRSHVDLDDVAFSEGNAFSFQRRVMTTHEVRADASRERNALLDLLLL